MVLVAPLITTEGYSTMELARNVIWVFIAFGSRPASEIRAEIECVMSQSSIIGLFFQL